MTFAEYLSRVLVYLLAFAGIGVAIYWLLLGIGLVRAAISGFEESTENES